MPKEKKERGAKAFSQYYQQVFTERWPKLLKALEKPSHSLLRWNRFYSDHPTGLDPQFIEGLRPFPLLPGCYTSKTQAPPPQSWGEKIFPYYPMDGASVLAARAPKSYSRPKNLRPLLCTGRKALVLGESLFPDPLHLNEKTKLMLNEPSPPRRERLKKVVKNYLPQWCYPYVEIKGYEGRRWGLYQQDYYDRILLDAPCSSERHLLHSPTHLDQWTPKRSKGLAAKQYALLVSALTALKSSGRLVYATCALSPLENDGVLERFFKKKKPQDIRVCHEDFPQGEKTPYGHLFLPDKGSFGPLYLAILEKF